MPSGRLLGVKGCYNRPSAIWEFRLPKAGANTAQEQIVGRKLTPESRSARSPHLSPDGSCLIWISNAIGGAHSSCATLHCMDIRSGEQRVLVDTIWTPRDSDGFPGLYEPVLPSKTFVSLGKGPYVVASSYWRSRTTLLLISVDGGDVKELTPLDADLYSWTILSTDSKNRIVCVRSSPSVPHEVVLGEIDDDLCVSWQLLVKTTLTLEGAPTTVT